MRRLIVFAAAAMVVLAAMDDVCAEGCKDQAAVMAQTAEKEWQQVQKNFDEMMPTPSDYMDEVKKCIGSLGSWTGTIGFKLPSMDDILKRLCSEARSHIDIPRYDFNLNKTFGVGSNTLYKVGHKEEAEDVYRDIWGQIWEE